VKSIQIQVVHHIRKAIVVNVESVQSVSPNGLQIQNVDSQEENYKYISGVQEKKFQLTFYWLHI
jgi:hypothetical protein